MSLVDLVVQEIKEWILLVELHIRAIQVGCGGLTDGGYG